MIAGQADPPWKVLADSVGSDIGSEVQSYPLNFRQLKGKCNWPNGPIAMGYSTRYGGIINCSAKKYLRMKTLLLVCMLIGSSLQADDTKKFSEIETVLKGDPKVKIATAEDANKLLFSEIGKPTGGISAYWSWSIRDAFMLPSDWEGIGKAGEVVWIGQLNSLDGAPLASQPLAVYYINANSGKIFTLKRPSKKKTAEQDAPSNGG